ncbi:MAG: DUF1287 domain-containing protein [Parvularculaceae bacterium]|nr:DUF1287 domain-containing protein [Parvularculaceae bacterium]
MRILACLAAAILAASPAAADQAAFAAKVAAAAIDQTVKPGVYDPSYVQLDYPMGDVPADRGVCTDVVIRSLRAAGVDLQARVHEDMKADFAAYPKRWGAGRPDRNIDHRRVPNLEVYFTRAGWRLPASRVAADYRAGDIVAWNLKNDAGFLPHIGVVTDRLGASGRPLIAHNIGAGPKMEDVLFDWKITGRFRPKTDD